MNTKEYIESGILELYIAGALSEKENKEVYYVILQDPVLLKEVLNIEASIVKITAATSPIDSKYLFLNIKEKLGISDSDNSKIIPINYKTNWLKYSGWAAAVLLTGGLAWSLILNNDLTTQIQTADSERILLEQQIENAQTNLAEVTKLNNILRDRNITSVILAGQAVSPDAYAKVYWDKKTQTVYLDAQGLPEPPKGKVYQVWSLTLNPLTPTNLGIIDDFMTDDNKIFSITNSNDSQAFGITLEPEGGSESPTLEQLFTLGIVETTP